MICFHPMYLLISLTHSFSKYGVSPRHQAGQATGHLEIKTQTTHTQSLPPQAGGGGRAMVGITETEVTDPLGIGWGPQNPRGGKVGLAWSPFGKPLRDLFG